MLAPLEEDPDGTGWLIVFNPPARPAEAAFAAIIVIGISLIWRGTRTAVIIAVNDIYHIEANRHDGQGGLARVRPCESDTKRAACRCFCCTPAEWGRDVDGG